MYGSDCRRSRWWTGQPGGSVVVEGAEAEETGPAGFPPGFWWGTAASSTQTEGASEASDWWAWEQAGRVPASGAGNGFATRYAEDFALLSRWGLTHHRLSLDWAR